jgi:hypothetical protein
MNDLYLLITLGMPIMPILNMVWWLIMIDLCKTSMHFMSQTH